MSKIVADNKNNTGPIKVLHLIDSGGLYGAEKMLLALVTEQVKQGLQPMILSAGIVGEPEKPLETEVKKLGLPLKVWRMKPGFNLTEAKKIHSWADAEGYTYLHSHGFKFNVLLVSVRIFSNVKQKLIASVHGYIGGKRYSKLWLYELLDGWALKFFDAVVVVSSPMLELPVIKAVNKNKVCVINNGISNLRTDKKLSDDLKQFIQPYKVKAIVVGRLSREKGITYLLQALTQLPNKADIGLVLVGEGGERESLELEAKSLGLSNVLFAGYMDNAGDIINHFDVLVMPSLTEGLPITILEAMRSGIDIVATKVGGIPSVLSPDMAFLVNKENIVELVSALSDVIAGGNKFGAKDEFMKNYTSSVMAEKYMSVYS